MNHNSQPTSLYSGLTQPERFALYCAIAAWRMLLAQRLYPRAFSFRSLACSNRMLAALPLLLCLIGAVAAQPTVPRPSKACSFVYINGDAVISCPKAVR